MKDNRPKCIVDAVEEMTGPHDFVPTTSDGLHGQRHPHGYVGKMFRINDPETVRVGHCFLRGRLKKDDLFLCIRHSGDCFQDYMYVEEYENCYIGQPIWQFGSYGIGDASVIEIDAEDFEILKKGGKLYKQNGR